MTLIITMICHDVEWNYAECGILFFIMLSVIVLNVVMLSVVMLSVVAPLEEVPVCTGHKVLMEVDYNSLPIDGG
jgi:hypothetical protein